MTKSAFLTTATAAAIALIGLQTIATNAFSTRTLPSSPKATSSWRQRSSGITILNSNKQSTSNSISMSILDSITINDKIVLRDPTPDERGKGGVRVKNDNEDGVKALEVLARIPRNLIIASVIDETMPSAVVEAVVEAVASARNITWATELTAMTLAVLHNNNDDDDNIQTKQKKEWIQSWQTGGWGSPNDLGPDISNTVTANSLLATGSDNDHNVYAKFRMPCHPALFQASMGLNLLTKCTEDEARTALYARGGAYRGMRDALSPLVITSTREGDKSIKGTVRDKRSWDVADTLDNVLARATTLTLDGDDGDTTEMAHAIVPIHERLGHALNGGNTKLVSLENDILLVATRDIEAGEEITRDYTLAPILKNDESTVVGSALHLLLQFGLPPSAFPAEE